MKLEPLSIALIALASSASAQRGAPMVTRPVPASPHYAGVYHVGTGSWTRRFHAASSPSVLYDNTCPTGYFSSLSTDTYVDEGRVPSLTSPTSAVSRPGYGTQYRVDGFQIGYCTDQPPSTFGTWNVAFFHTYADCSSASSLTSDASFALTGLPASSSGATACWIVDVDLMAGTDRSFVLLADGDGDYAAPGSANLFGWSMRSTAAGTGTGPLIAGDLSLCAAFDGTCWDFFTNFAEPGTGMGTTSHFYVEGGSTPAGCYFFPGLPMSSFHLQLYGDCAGETPCTTFCPGDGSGTICPCGNSSTMGSDVGCKNSTGNGASLRCSGNPSISADTFVLHAAGMTPGPKYFYRGSTPIAAGVPLFDGLRCIAGSLIQLKSMNVPSDVASYPTGTDPLASVKGLASAGLTQHYQVLYRDNAFFCTWWPWNTTNGVSVTWTP